MSRRIYERHDDSLGKKVELYSPPSGEPEIYVDGAWGFTFTNGVCKINLFTITPSEPDGPTARQEVAVRLVMPLATMAQLRDFFDSQLTALTEQLNAMIVEQAEPPRKKRKATL